MSKITQVKFQITNECNLFCGFCHSNCRFRHGSEIQFNEIQQTIDAFLEHSLEEVVVTGGEPLCRPSIMEETLKYADEHGVKTGLYSNGTLITRSCAKKMAECNLDWIQVCLEGSQAAVHDPLRGEGTFKKIVRGIKNLQECGIEVRLRSSIFKTNYHDIPFILELAKELGVSRYLVRPFIPVGRGQAFYDRFYPSYLQREQAVRSLLVLRKKRGYPPITFLPTCFEFLYPEYSPGETQEGPPSLRESNGVRLCKCGREIIFIDCTGNIKPVGHFPGHLGSIRGGQSVEVNIQNALNEAKILHEIDLPPSEIPCVQCNFWNLCRRSCYSTTYALTGSVDHVHPLCPKLSQTEFKNK